MLEGPRAFPSPVTVIPFSRPVDKSFYPERVLISGLLRVSCARGREGTKRHPALITGLINSRSTHFPESASSPRHSTYIFRSSSSLGHSLFSSQHHLRGVLYFPVAIFPRKYTVSIQHLLQGILYFPVAIFPGTSLFLVSIFSTAFYIFRSPSSLGHSLFLVSIFSTAFYIFRVAIFTRSFTVLVSIFFTAFYIFRSSSSLGHSLFLVSIFSMAGITILSPSSL